MTSYFKRGEFTALVGGMTVAWPLSARVPRAEGDISITGRNVNRADEPMHVLGDPMGERIAAPSHFSPSTWCATRSRLSMRSAIAVPR
jgi:hypothetical protein